MGCLSFGKFSRGESAPKALVIIIIITVVEYFVAVARGVCVSDMNGSRPTEGVKRKG